VRRKGQQRGESQRAQRTKGHQGANPICPFSLCLAHSYLSVSAGHPYRLSCHWPRRADHLQLIVSCFVARCHPVLVTCICSIPST
jgi:hypothetical protein